MTSIKQAQKQFSRPVTEPAKESDFEFYWAWGIHLPIVRKRVKQATTSALYAGTPMSILQVSGMHGKKY